MALVQERERVERPAAVVEIACQQGTGVAP